MKAHSTELVTVKFRYKSPKGKKSRKITSVTQVGDFVAFQGLPSDIRFSIAAAAFGMKLRNSKYVGKFSYEDVAKIATQAVGEDMHGYRSEFIRLVETAAEM